jgi:hypothetical protein
MIYAQARALNVLALGEESALQLGVEAERVKRIVFVASSLLTGVIVAQTGPIGFVGLIVPHGVRPLIGADNRLLLPVAPRAAAHLPRPGGHRWRASSCSRRSCRWAWCGVLRSAVLRLSPADPPAAARPVSAPSPVFAASGVEFGYGGAFRLAGASFEVAEGEIMGLVGPNSSGKTTLLRLLSKVHAPDRGEIRFRGRLLGAVARLDLAGTSRSFPGGACAFPVSVEELVLMGRFPGRGAAFEGPADPRGPGGDEPRRVLVGRIILRHARG